YDIIFFWVARMAFQTRYCMKNRPFKDVLIHWLVRDTQGRKMSKSLGNGVDPMDVIEHYGVDALRFFLTTNSTPGQDLRFSEEKVESSANFINKIWNASRFVLMQCGNDMDVKDIDLSNVSMIDKWILRRFNEVLASVSANMDKYEYALVGNELYSFVWDDFCSWYIELSKAGLMSDDVVTQMASKSTLVSVLSGILRMLHPFMPFVSEEIYQAIPHEMESINLDCWPTSIPVDLSDEEMTSIKQLITMIEAVRSIKADYNLKPSFDIDVIIKNEHGDILPSDTKINAILQKMCHASWVSEDREEEMMVRSILNGTLSVPLASIINVEEEIEKLTKELSKLQGEIKRGEGMLANPNFTNKAPEAKVNAEKEKLEGYKSQYTIVEKQLEDMKKKA
ncbi:MAG: class I tRNA ligase family protein, partial [Longicatena sp.]